MPRFRLISAVVGALLLALPAYGANKVPSPLLQEVLIKTSLLTLNDANLTGDYAVLHAKLAKPLREHVSLERLKASFKSFAEKKTDWAIIAAKVPVTTAEPRIDSRGVLILHGYFDTRPSLVTYELEFAPSEGTWKPVMLNVHVKPVDKK